MSRRIGVQWGLKQLLALALVAAVVLLLTLPSYRATALSESLVKIGRSEQSGDDESHIFRTIRQRFHAASHSELGGDVSLGVVIHEPSVADFMFGRRRMSFMASIEKGDGSMLYFVQPLRCSIVGTEASESWTVSAEPALVPVQGQPSRH